MNAPNEDLMSEPCNHGASRFELQAGGREVAVLRSLDDAKRIRACWNACEGYTTEELERMTVNGGMRTYSHEVVKSVASQRDELLEIVRVTIGNVRSLGPAGALAKVYEPYQEWLAQLEAAYAKATGSDA